MTARELTEYVAWYRLEAEQAAAAEAAREEASNSSKMDRRW